MIRSQIRAMVDEVLIESLCVDKNHIHPDSTLIGDLGATWTDLLDIAYWLGRKFEIRISKDKLPSTVELLCEYIQDQLDLTEIAQEIASTRLLVLV